MPLPTSSRVGRYLSVFIRWLTVTLVVFIATLWVGKYIFDNFVTKTFVATSQVAYEPPPKSDADTAALMRGEAQKIASPDVLLPVIYDLELEKTWASKMSFSGEEVASGDEAVAYLQGLVKVEPVRDLPYTLDISVSGENPAEAAGIANSIATHYKAVRAQSVAKDAPSPVQIISEATPPKVPAHPNKTLCYYLIFAAAAIVGLFLGCFVEVILLFIRASQEEGT